MAYRGEDLDLRTPQTWNASPDTGVDGYVNGSRGGGRRPQPILVDDIVLACSNYAFDVAVAHRASEVRIEHLLHAMTRVDGAANALEARGIRVAGLRRESSTIIAGEIPIGLSAGQGRPRRSDDFETILRSASAIAYRRNGPANVDDVLDSLLDMPADVPGIALLARHGGRVVRDRRPSREPMPMPMRDREPVRETVRDRDYLRDREPFRDTLRDGRDTLRDAMPLPPLTRPPSGYVSDVRLNDMTETVRDRAPKTAVSPYAADLARPVRNDLVGTTTDGIQNARIDQLENAVRTLTTELTNERTIVSGVVADLQRNMKAERDDTSRFRGGLADRLQSLEQTVLSANKDDGRDERHAQLHDRMKSLEYSILDSRKDDGSTQTLLDRLASVERGLEQRVSELSRPWSVLSDRLLALEQTLLDTRGKGGADLNGVHDRMASLERAIRETATDGNRSNAVLGDRMKQLERTLEAGASKGIDLSPIANRLDIIEEAVLTRDDTQSSDKLAERMRGLEEAVNTQKSLFLQTTQTTQALAADVKGLSSALATQSANTERTHSFVTERMQALTSGLERQRGELMGPLNERLNGLAQMLDGRTQATLAPLMDRMNAMTTTVDMRTQAALTPLINRMTTLATAIETRGTENQLLVQTLGERMTMLETKLAESIQKTAEAQAAHTAELREVHDALIKLNSNQHTLAGSIDQWRLDGVGDISVISKQLENVEKAAAKPQQAIEQLTASMDAVNKVTVERYHRRNRFWYWMFGTDDWLTASWPSQVANVEAERTALRAKPITEAGPRSTTRA